MTATLLQQPPSLAPLYARAALVAATHRGGGGRPLRTDDRISVADQVIDRGQLDRFAHICGTRVGDVLPPTYLHLLSFPLSVARMNRPDFPFALLGLVHVHNRITQLRPVTAGERVTVTVWAANPAEVAAGRQIDLVSEVQVGIELVWTETSTYLSRGRGTGERVPRAEPEPPTGPVIRWRVPDDTGRRYAAVSGDCNPIHLHAVTARLFGFRKAIAHGMWLKARTLAAFEGRLPAAFEVDVAFKTPTFLPSQVQLDAVPADGGWRLAVSNSRSGKPHLTGTITPR